MQKEITRQAFVNAGLTALYIAFVASFLFYVPPIFLGNKPDTVFAPIVMLMLFVFSAAITASLMLGKPILWYIDGKKREAVQLLFSTLLFFFCIILLAFTVSILASR